MIKKMILGALAIGLFATSCSNDDDATVVSTTSGLTINLNGLEALGANFVYEGWVIVEGIPVSTGTFSSVAFPQTFQVNTVQLNVATKFVLSIEPAEDLDPLPAATKVLAGDFSGNSANVWVAPVTTNADMFTGSWGRFFLRTPTDETGTNNGNDENGIWFGTPGTMPPAAGLGLPTLAPGWKYEGWVVVDGVGPISTGTFTGVTEVDDSNNFSGTQNNAGPPIPGEDFFLNTPTGFTFPLDVRGRTAVISIEPFPDNSPAPFAMKPLVGAAGAATAPATHDLSLNLDSLPTGTVTR
ncbi:anti-sigma factor [Lacinutrix jangbogonensis]|uniref:anti-sigma factor n=1 Tax=Lacinutrix jangbogonensis TaxID=1469557 RepID=UPI00053EA58B|nr:anti-sigma factor [Lacinutrix jangbogonensis]